MRLPVYLANLVLASFLMLSCDKEYSLENAITHFSSGSLKTEAGDCMPSGSNGTFRKSIPVDSANFIYVDIDVFTKGAYLVRSDTVNGMHFSTEGVFKITGVQRIKLHAFGTPFTNGTVPYHVQYGKQKCIVNVFTIGP